MKHGKRESIKKLRQKWRNLHWPQVFPPLESSLNKPACDLVQHDTFVAGCISQIAQDGKLERRLWPVLAVDQDLTDRIVASNDPMKDEFLEYKARLDECIRLAREILRLEGS